MSRKKFLKKEEIENFAPQTIGDRINLVIALSGLTSTKFSKKFGVSSGNLSGLINDDNKPSAKFLALLLEYFDVSADWVLTGDGEMGRCPIPKLNVYNVGAVQFKIQKSVAKISNCSFDYDDEKMELLRKVSDIINSESQYAELLKANIRSFHNAMEQAQTIKKNDEWLKAMQAEIDALKSGHPERRKEDIPIDFPDRREGGDRRNLNL